MIRVVLLSVLALTACGGGSDGIQCASAEAVLAEVNAARSEPRQCGGVNYSPVPPLSMSAVLTQAAERHAQDLAATGRASHVGSDGSTVTERAKAYGRPVGENVAAGQVDLEQVMSELLNSSGHCQNIMNPYAKQFGAACVESNRAVWVQVFGV